VNTDYAIIAGSVAVIIELGFWVAVAYLVYRHSNHKEE